jgi:multiple sugar transport system permease protein
MAAEASFRRRIRPWRARGGTRARREARAALAMISPTFVVILVMVILPVLWALVLSFKQLRLIDLQYVNLFGGPFTLDNYAQVLGSSAFLTPLRTTLEYSVFGTMGSILLGLMAAMALRSKFRGRGLVRGVILLPWVAPVVAITFVWNVLLSPQLGFVNAVGTHIFGWTQPIPFLSQQHGTVTIFGLGIGVPTALVTVIAFEAWRSFPFAFLFILARLQAIPPELEEAARSDGATPTQVFRYVILPQLMGVIALIAVLRFIFTFNDFDSIYLLTGGGAGTQVLATQVYSFLTAQADVGGAAAVAAFMAAMLVVVLVVYVKFFGDREEQV